MTERISLALVFHNHQPVGNFGWVIEEVWTRSYEPMLAALERHPGVHVGLHYTGPLLEWMRENRPEALERLAALVQRRQVEILGGGHYEPILASLPQADRHGQLVRMADELQALFGSRPRGAWLAERVWEPSLPFDLAEAGYAYTVLDDNHLRGASVKEDAMWGTYTTDDQGRLLTIFGTEQGLRYRIPWVPVREVIDYLRSHATEDGRRLGTMGDDGEKFGAWPETYELCWGKTGWVEECFTALEANAGWLSTVTPSAWLDREPPLGRIYVPASSYVEMTEWALPPDEAPVFHRLLESAREAAEPAQRFLRGAMWRNFQARYREINDLHKQMLRVSAKVAAMPPGPLRERARDHLYRGQSNDCYWHGLFGGIYIVHMRMATLSHLIAAEDLADGGSPRTRVDDLDLDGLDEVLLGAPGQSVLVDLEEGAGIGSWDLIASRVALASVLRRRPEAYHATLMEHERAEAERQAAAIAAAAAGTSTPVTASAPTSPHANVVLKEAGLAALLRYDPYERRSGLVHVLPPAAPAGTDRRSREAADGPGDLAALRVPDRGDLADGAWQLVDLVGPDLTVRRDGSARLGTARVPLRVTKRIALGGDRIEPTLELTLTVQTLDAGIDATLDVEWNLNLMGGGGNPAAFYELPAADGGRSGQQTAHDASGDAASAERLWFGNTYAGVDIELRATPAARISWYPVDAISNSEAGFERVYQGSSLHLRWPMRLAPRNERTWSVRFRVAQTRDVAAEEAPAALDDADAPGLEFAGAVGADRGGPA